MLDETTDHSNKSILMLLVMYINSVGDIIADIYNIKNVSGD